MLSLYESFRLHLKRYKKVEKPASTFYHRAISKNGAKLATFVFLKFNVSPNAISLLSFLAVFTSCGFIATSSHLGWALVLLQFAYICDCSDGVVARITESGSKFGELLDVSLDRILGTLFAFALYIHLESQYELLLPQALYTACLVSYLSYTLLATLRGYIFPDLKGFTRRATPGLASKLLRVVYEFIDTGIYYLLISVALLIKNWMLPLFFTE